MESLQAGAFFRHLDEVPFLDTASHTAIARPQKGSQAKIKWLGGTPENGPWVYWIQHPAGALIKPHKHFVARIEYLLEGRIEWFEGDAALTWRGGGPTMCGDPHGAGSLSFVPAGTVYAYRILEDCTLLHVFYGNPVTRTEHVPEASAV